MACRIENMRETQTNRIILVRVNKLRKFPTRISFRLFRLELVLNLSFLKTMTVKLNAKENRSRLVKRNSFVLGN